MTTYFEDLAVGDSFASGTYAVTETEIREFADRYDPQPFHVDPEAAAQSQYGGLIASGWHTAAMTMRLIVDGHLGDAASMGARGVDELRWSEPVRPGDKLRAESEVLDKRVETDERGLVRTKTETEVDGDVVFSMIGLVMYGRRGDGG